MFGSQVAEVVAGVVFVYWALSMVCSSLKELVARIFDMRARTLEEAIGKMLGDPGLASKIFANHLIASSVEPGGKPSYISSRNFALALFDVLSSPTPAGPRTLQDLTSGLKNIPSASIQSTILGLLNSAQGDLDTARKRVENWYDDSMERVSGWYKRKAQWIIFVLGLLLCAILNGDTLMITRELSGAKWPRKRKTWPPKAIQTLRRLKLPQPCAPSAYLPLDGISRDRVPAQSQRMHAPSPAVRAIGFGKSLACSLPPLPLPWVRLFGSTC
jgi:hypothetical protein